MSNVMPYVDARWLRARLSDADIRIVDCRFRRDDEDYGTQAYREGHIPDAVHLDLHTDLCGESSDGGRHPLPSGDAFTRSIRRAGVGTADHVIAYDDGDHRGAARLWFLLRHFGHDRVSVLQGGFPSWDGPIETQASVPPLGNFDVAPSRDDVASAEWLLAAAQDQTPLQVVDVRTPDRYRGDNEPFDPVGGHIPGAVNVPLGDEDGVQRILEEDAEVVVYCGSGIAAGVMMLDLAHHGREDVKLYPGSWSEWSRRDLPVARG